MNAKKLVTAGLALFVVASLVTLVLKETGTGQTAARPVAATPGEGTKLVAYYLHGKIRCATCNDIEKTAQETVESSFARELRAGRIEWKSVNYEEPGNEHFATDYKLAAPCVVLVSYRNGRRDGWRSLDQVWELIGDRPAFRKLIETNIREELGERPGTEPEPTPVTHAVPMTLPSQPGRPKLLDLGSTRCIPCKQMAPILEDLKGTYSGKLDVVFIDVIEESSAAETYDISTIPTQIFFDAAGTERFRHEGFFSKEEILAKWQELGVELVTSSKPAVPIEVVH